MELKSRCPQWECCSREGEGGAMNKPRIDVAKTQGKLKRDQVSKNSPTNPAHTDSRCTTAPAIDIKSRWIQGTQCEERQTTPITSKTDWRRTPFLSQRQCGHSELATQIQMSSWKVQTKRNNWRGSWSFSYLNIYPQRNHVTWKNQKVFYRQV